MNGKSQLFYKYTGTNTWKKLITHDEIYDLKLGSKVSDNNEYSWAYLIKDGNQINLRGSKFTIKSDYFNKNDCGGQKELVKVARTHTRGCFENNYDHFYFLSYTDTSDFACGYWTNEESPLEFVDEVEIEHIRFIYNYKYAYYKIKNLANNKYYYGIIDIKKNIVVFNTEKEILTYVPFSDISMLAITSTSAYEICVIKQNGECIDSNQCTDTNKNYIIDLEGNKCADACESGKILLVRENMCSDTCDQSIYVLYNNKCGLCKQLFPSTPYKLINTTNCLAANNFPEGSEIYNPYLYLLKCKSGYKLEGEACVANVIQHAKIAQIIQ